MAESKFTIERRLVEMSNERKENGYTCWSDARNENKKTNIAQKVRVEAGQTVIDAEVKNYGSFQLISKVYGYPEKAAEKTSPAKSSYKKSGYTPPPVTDPRVFELKEMRDLLNREIAICASSIVPPLQSTWDKESLLKRVALIREIAWSNVEYIITKIPFMEKKKVVAKQEDAQKKAPVQESAEKKGIKTPEEVAIPF